MDDSIAGVERSFARVWQVVTGRDGDGPPPGMQDRTVAAVAKAIERLGFNVALARLMELTPVARSPEARRVLVRLLAPFASHLAEELWSRLDEPFSVHAAPWPGHDPEALVARRVELVVQVHGKVVGRVDVPTGLDEAEAAEAAAAVAAGAVADRPVRRIVHVPDRLVNLAPPDRFSAPTTATRRHEDDDSAHFCPPEGARAGTLEG